jgi:hypothetical protein
MLVEDSFSGKKNLCLLSRVTRLGEISPNTFSNWAIVYFGSFLIAEGVHFFRLYINFDKIGFGYIYLGRSFHNLIWSPCSTGF